MLTTLILNFSLVIAPAAPDFGAKLESVKAEQAAALCGLKEAGLAVREISQSSLAEEMGLRVKDVVFNVNGQRVLTVKEFDSLNPSREVRIQIEFGRAGTRFTIDRAPGPSSDPVRVHFVGEATSETADLLRASGFEVSTSLNVPPDLGRIPVLVIENDRACKPGIATLLEKRIKEGGGVVLTGGTPWYLSGASPGEDVGSYDNTNPIAAWFGISADGRTTLQNGDEVTVGVSRPLGSGLSKGAVVFRSNGELHIPYLPATGFDEYSSLTLIWNSPNSSVQTRGFGFSHTYGKGRMYYQVFPSRANYPKLGEIFCAGVRWAAGGQLP